MPPGTSPAGTPHTPSQGAPTIDAPADARRVNALSVDVEDWFQVQALAEAVPRAEWERMPRRVEASTDRLLALFERAGARATFFTLGWVAERHPLLVRRIVAAGHELASHGCDHRLVTDLAPEQFAADVARSRDVLEQVGGAAVAGYRAPTFSIGPRTPWAHDLLARAGYRYSSSTFPIRHDLYGAPDAPRLPHRPNGGALWELPMTTLRLLGRNLPCSGGGWFRLVPYALFRTALRGVNRGEPGRPAPAGAPGPAPARPAIFYIHPWEVDPGQPRVPGLSATARFRHRNNLGRTEARLARLLRDFRWDRMDQVFAAELGGSGT